MAADTRLTSRIIFASLLSIGAACAAQAQAPGTLDAAGRALGQHGGGGGSLMAASVALVATGALFYAMARPYGSTTWERVLAAALSGGGIYGLLGTAAAGLPASAVPPAFGLAALVVGAVVYALERLERVLAGRAAGRRAAAAGARRPTAAAAGAGTWWPGRRRMAHSG